VAGEVVGKNDGIKIVSGGQELTLEHPKVDPYWDLVAQLSQ